MNSSCTAKNSRVFNARAALQWVYSEVEDPEMVVLGGCSAGGYGALLHSAYVAAHYPTAQLRVIVDAAAGITTSSFIKESLVAWDALATLSETEPLRDVDLESLSFEDVFRAVASYWPHHRYAMYSTAHDDLQKFIYKAMGGKDVEWPERLLDAVSSLMDTVPNFRCHVPAGTLHCILPFHAFYLREVNGVFFRQWIEDFVFSQTLPEAQICEGPDCQTDPLCNQCGSMPQDHLPFYCLACTGGTGGY